MDWPSPWRCRSGAATLRFAFQGELKSLDPYSLNESFTLGMLGNVYEGLTKRDKDLKIIPGLAERWEMLEPTRWRFYLRKGVKFHNGEDFTADDVVFSAERSFSTASDIKTRIQPAGTKAVKVDDHTVDFVLPSPNPILHYEWDTWYIMSKKWAEANNSAAVQTGGRPADELCGAQHQRHRAVHPHQPSGGRAHHLQEEPELVGQGRAQYRRGDLHHHRQ